MLSCNYPRKLRAGPVPPIAGLGVLSIAAVLQACRAALLPLALAGLILPAVSAAASPPGPLEARLAAGVTAMRRACAGGGSLAAVGPEVRALARDREARTLLLRRYRKDFDALVRYEVLLVAMAFDWERGAFDEAVATAEAWQSDGIPLFDGMFLLLRILEHRAVAARGVLPPRPGWPLAWRIEAVKLPGLEGALVVAWNAAECPGMGPPMRRMLVALYAPAQASDRLRQLGAAAEADLPDSFEYGNRFFDTVTFPDKTGAEHSYLVARYSLGEPRSNVPASIELLAVDATGLRRVRVERGSVIHELRDLAHDGRYEAIAFDPRWNGGCTAPIMAKTEPQGPKGALTCAGSYDNVGLVLDWRDGGLIEACRDFPGYYEALIAPLSAGHTLPPGRRGERETQFQRRMSDAFGLFAATLQQGRIDEALARFDAATESSSFAGEERVRARKAARYLRSEVERQRSALDRPCPMSGLELR